MLAVASMAAATPAAASVAGAVPGSVSTARIVIVICRPPSGAVADAGGEVMPERRADDAEQHRGDDIERGTRRLARAQQLEGLQAERREGSESAAQPDHDEKPSLDAGRARTVGHRQGAEETDDERAEHVDEQRAIRKRVAQPTRH